MGYNVLALNTTGTSNIAIGTSALQSNTTGFGNIALGNQAGQNLTTGGRNIMIDNPGVAGEAFTIRLGTPGVHSTTHIAGEVFIGTNPTSSVQGSLATLQTQIDAVPIATVGGNLDLGIAGTHTATNLVGRVGINAPSTHALKVVDPVNGSTTLQIAASANGTAHLDGLWINTNTLGDASFVNRENGRMFFGNNAVNQMEISAAGNVGIGSTGTSNAAFKLTVAGDAAKPGGGSWAVSSDRRLKKNIVDLDGALDELLALRGVNFEYLDPQSSNGLPGINSGFIAQEVEEVIPQWVTTNAETGLKSVSISGFEARVVEALRTLVERNQRIQTEKDAEIAELHKRLALLEGLATRLASIEKQLGVPAAVEEEK